MIQRQVYGARVKVYVPATVPMLRTLVAEWGTRRCVGNGLRADSEAAGVLRRGGHRRA